MPLLSSMWKERVLPNYAKKGPTQTFMNYLRPISPYIIDEHKFIKFFIIIIFSIYDYFIPIWTIGHGYVSI